MSADAAAANNVHKKWRGCFKVKVFSIKLPRQRDNEAVSNTPLLIHRRWAQA
jgi:hypothetical protein